MNRRPPAILALGPREVIEATPENLARVAMELLAPIKPRNERLAALGYEKREPWQMDPFVRPMEEP
jgi:hypothetical protein